MTQSFGFSLVELVVIIVVMGVLAALVIPRYSGGAINVGAETDRMANDIRFAQALAMARGERHCFSVASSTGYRIRRGTACATDVAHPATGSTNLINLGNNVTYTASNLSTSYLQFDGRGRPTTLTAPTGSARFTLSGDDETRRIYVSGETGRVSVE